MARHRAYKVEFERQAVEEHPGAAVRLLTATPPGHRNLIRARRPRPARFDPLFA
jgi:hypothetical protein